MFQVQKWERQIDLVDNWTRKKKQKKTIRIKIFIKNHWLHSLSEIVIEGLEVDILEKIKIARGKNKEIVRIIEKIKKVNVKVLREDEWQIEGELVLKKEKVYVPRDEELRIEIIIIWLHYDIPVA